MASRLIWTADEDGVIYIVVQALGDNQAGPKTGYGVCVSEVETPLLIPDEHEPDDTREEANGIEVGEIQTHNVHVEGDHDWLSFQAVEGTTYVVETSNLGQEVDTIIFLYDENGEELAQDDDGADEPRASRMTWAADKAGGFYVMVRDYKDSRAEHDMGYDISIRESEPDLGEAEAYIANGVYHIIVHQTNRFIVDFSKQLSLENFTLEADTPQVTGDEDSEYGLVQGYQDNDNYYEVAISGDESPASSPRREGPGRVSPGSDPLKPSIRGIQLTISAWRCRR